MLKAAGVVTTFCADPARDDRDGPSSSTRRGCQRWLVPPPQGTMLRPIDCSADPQGRHPDGRASGPHDMAVPESSYERYPCGSVCGWGGLAR